MRSFDVHAAERDIKMGIARTEHPHEPAVIAAGRMLIGFDKVEGFPLGQSADGGCRIECL